MAEALSVIADEILNKFNSLPLQEIAPWCRVKDELKYLKDRVSRVQYALLDAELKQVLDAEVKNWLGRLQQVLYDADNLLDDLVIEAQRYQLMAGSRMAKKVCLFVYGFKIVGKIKKIREGLAHIQANTPLSLKNGARKETVSKVTLSSETIVPVVIGREADEQAIIKFLSTPDNSENVSVLSIVGDAGIGKTTLAQHVFRSNEHNFELKIWVNVSDDFDLKMIARKILESVTSEKPEEYFGVVELLSKLGKFLHRKKYLLVLDDACIEASALWDNLRKLLPGGWGSKMLITTRSEKVAQSASTVKPYVLKRLSLPESWSLFLQVALEGQEPKNSNIKRIGEEILKKCGGVPLVIKTIAGILRNRNTEKEWSSFLRTEFSSIIQSNNGILQALELSYHNLPSSLKNCFAYCGLFPKDHEFDVEMLINQWKGQGYIESSGSKKCLEDIGLEYFMHLLLGSFFQQVKRDALGNIKSCKMNNLMRDLASSMAGTQNMIVNSDKNIDVDEKTYHVSLGFHFDPSYCSIPSAKQLRTFLLPCQEVWPSNEGRQKMSNNETSFSNFRNLRVFDLHNSGIEKVPTCIHKMKYLRYLDLSRNDQIKALPNSISRLQLLQVLKLSNCEELRELPKDITKLVNLTHLDCERCWSLKHMPCGLGKLTSLQMLTWFPVAKDSSVSNHVGGLVELNRLNLKGRIEIRNLKYVKAESEFKAADLMEKQLLQSLSLCWNRDDDDDDNDNVDVNYDERCLERLRPHENLKKLKVCDYGGTKFPYWLSSLTNLVDICIQDCGNCDRLPRLDRIPSLQYLRIDGFPKLEFIYHEGDNFPGAGGGGNESTFFPSLKELYILDCPRLKSWWKKGDDLTMKITAELPHFTRLSKLEISECPQLTCMPLFPNLDEKLLLENCSLVQHLQQMIKMAIVQAVPSTSSSSSSSSSMLGLSKLKALWVVSSEDLKAFPQELLLILTSLEELHLKDCPRLASLPLEMRQLALRDLDIKGCSQLKEKYGTRKCSDWPIISHIPNIQIDGQKVQWEGSYLWDQKDSSIVTASPLSKLKTLIVEDLESLPEDWLPNLTRLQQLCLVRCPKLKSLPRGMLHLTSLQILDISQCTLHLKERCSNDKGVDWLNISHIPRIKIDGLQIQWQEQKAIEGEAAKMLSSEDILGVNTYPPGHSTPRTEVPAEKHSDPAKITAESNQLEGVPGYPQLDQKSYNEDQLAVLKYIIYENNDNETLFEGDNCVLARSRIEYWKPRQWLENNDVDMVVEAVRKEEVRERNGTNWFFPCITYESYKDVSSFKVYYDDHVRNFAVTSDLEACEKIYIPIHHYDRRHFLLAVLKVPNQTCLWYDPMWSDEGSTLTDNGILPVLLEGLDNCVPGIKTKPFFPTFEEVIQKNAPRQPNGWDCGIYVMNFLRDLPDDNGKQSGKIVVNVTERDHEKFSQALRVECLLWVLFHEANKKRDGLLLEAKKLQNKLMDSDNNSDEKEARG